MGLAVGVLDTGAPDGDMADPDVEQLQPVAGDKPQLQQQPAPSLSVHPGTIGW